MPFKSRSQEKKLWMLKNQGRLPGVNLHEWAAKTDQKSLPEHVKRTKKEASFEKRSGPVADRLKQYFFKKKDAKKEQPARHEPDSDVEARREEELKAAYARGMVDYLVEAGEDPAPILKAAGLI